MAKLPLVIAPDPRLKQVSVAVDKIDKDLQKFMDDMLETMYHEEGAGLAAVQVGVLKRIMVIDIEEIKRKNPIFFVNPEITFLSEETCIKNEGCLSFPGQRIEIERPSYLTVEFLDYDGNKQKLEADDWMARAVLHELDHLNGITTPDHASKLKREMAMKRALKIKKIIEQNKE
ncbi:MAG: peptide deformylase [Alphaproteobacteria bacterium]